MSRLVDMIVAGGSAAEITQELKDELFAKTAERVDTLRQVVADDLFDSSTAQDPED